MSGTKFHDDPMRCCCLDWCESPHTGHREEGGHHPKCLKAHEEGCGCVRCRELRGETRRKGEELIVATGVWRKTRKP